MVVYAPFFSDTNFTTGIGSSIVARCDLFGIEVVSALSVLSDSRIRPMFSDEYPPHAPTGFDAIDNRLDAFLSVHDIMSRLPDRTSITPESRSSRLASECPDSTWKFDHGEYVELL